MMVNDEMRKKVAEGIKKINRTHREYLKVVLNLPKPPNKFEGLIGKHNLLDKGNQTS